MGVPIVKKCCCCVSLHTGTVVIGCLYTIWALAELVGYILFVTLQPLNKEGEEMSTNKKVLYFMAAAVSAVHLALSILLVVADVRKLASMTLPWTIITGIITSAVFILGLTGISLVLQDWSEIQVPDAVFVAVLLVRAVVSAYCIVVVHSRHKEIMNDKNRLKGIRYRAVPGSVA
ncbi:uncharacterized protein LOC106137957 [Amyelois transitella]|uniref:uncharacterized protein LOC106137957 n=1 Tax=Amyelois transitella TaxID=680683 RepID=UPI00298FBD63|nr:uncharacterized protein LOC106137957 [Amyelois transitella]